MSGPLIASDKESAYGYNSVRNSDASSKNNQLNVGKMVLLQSFYQKIEIHYSLFHTQDFPLSKKRQWKNEDRWSAKNEQSVPTYTSPWSPAYCTITRSLHAPFDPSQQEKDEWKTSAYNMT